MSQPEVIRIYGSLWPCPARLADGLTELAAAAIPAADAIQLAADLLTISFEGIYFPVDEALDLIRANMQPDQKGRIDVFDLEAWRLVRYHIANGRITESGSELNTVLAMSGRADAGA